MAVEEPRGFDQHGNLITGWRFTEADVADIGMANELHWASPDGQAQLAAALDSLPSVRGTIKLSGYFDGG